MEPSRTKFYLDKQNAKWSGVCAGIAEYTGVDVTWVRVGAVVLTLAGGFPWTVIAYMATAWAAQSKPAGMYETVEDQKFWQRTRSNPSRSTAEVRSTLREIDRRIADIELHYTSRNSRLADEIDSLR